MQVYSLGHLCFSIIIGLASVILLGVNLLALAKRKRLDLREDIKSTSISFLFMLYGIYWASKAFDPPHQESQRTNVIGWVLLPIVIVTLATISFAKRRLPKEPTA